MTLPSPTSDPAIEQVENHLNLLQELAEVGMRLARRLDEGSQIDLQAARAGGRDGASAPLIGAAEAFVRLSRAIRLTLSLEVRTALELRARQAGRSQSALAFQAVGLAGLQPAPTAPRSDAGARLAEAEADGQACRDDRPLERAESAERLDVDRESLRERLIETEDLVETIDGRPFEAVVSQIRADLSAAAAPAVLLPRPVETAAALPRASATGRQRALNGASALSLWPPGSGPPLPATLRPRAATLPARAPPALAAAPSG